MDRDPSLHDESFSSRGHLIPIGLAILAVLLVPMFLYSVGPEGPIKVGDVVFSTDHHRVPLVNTHSHDENSPAEKCFLVPRMQLVVQQIHVSSPGSMIADPVSAETLDLSSCSPGRRVIVQAHQVTLKPDLWGGLRDTLSHFFSGD
jgi:hypothetical protein